jgi:hypothetical protein
MTVRENRTMAKWIIEQCDPDHIDEETGRIPWAVCNLDDPEFGRETFATKSKAMAYKKERERE